MPYGGSSLASRERTDIAIIYIIGGEIAGPRARALACAEMWDIDRVRESIRIYILLWNIFFEYLLCIIYARLTQSFWNIERESRCVDCGKYGDDEPIYKAVLSREEPT